jgi:signal transduction histidine kinase/CheY-like chemotaxis protein
MGHAALLRLSRELHEVDSLEDAMDRVVAAVTSVTRYQRAWLCLPITQTKGIEVIGYALADRVRVNHRMAELDITKDRLLTHGLTTSEPTVIGDMRSDPRPDQEQVAYFGNRTLILVPMLRLGERVGAFSVGTFAEEGVMPPTEQELSFIIQVAALVSAAAGRMRAEAKQRALEEKMLRAQRLESLGRLAGEVAHDFNNLLISIGGNAELAQMLLKEHPALPLVCEIERASRRAAGLTRQLLSFSRGQPLQRREVQLPRVVDGMAALLRSLLPADIALEVTHGPGPVTLVGDEGQIEQVLMNLVINARDAMQNRGTIRVATARVTLGADAISGLSLAPGDYVLLSVTDDGSGIPEATLSRIFEPFYTTKASGAGTGLGLAVVDSVARRHDGFVQVRTEEGKGTTFCAYFPTPSASGREAPTQSASHSSEESPVSSTMPIDVSPGVRGTEHLLVVEDEPLVRDLVERVLTSCGYRVSVVEDGQSALDILETEHGIALVIADLSMPRLGGEDLAVAMKRLPTAPPLLVMSGYARGDAAQKTFEHLLPKPFTRQQLVTQVRAVLDAHRRAKAG